ncbi:hypothetical protein Cme02nite_38420 [Catellatospora methionotrophica]|uniref:Uncharacterized protein n=1 Tax=Catellatospora methionotrophica TaxID=121620 RepID=A0A8J3LMS3_9ACTN|nr:hypothetical protein [Catellatospora methionotrophica]GIG15510.1 hypothetical protein Cme02nite_38420 [Catellatospora methionotrophica]
MNHQQVIGYLIAGHINHAFFALEDDDIKGCCTTCCGPCAALAYFRNNARQEADVAVFSIMSGPTERYDWQNPITFEIDWDQVGQCWANPCANAEFHDEL